MAKDVAAQGAAGGGTATIEAPAPEVAPKGATGRVGTIEKKGWDVLDVPAPKVAERPAQARTEWWIGITLEGAKYFQQLAIGGQAFCLYRNRIDVGTDRKIQNPEGIRRGMRLKLTADQERSIRDAVARTLVRCKAGAASVFDIDSSLYTPDPQTDQPVGSILFMVRVGSHMPADWESSEPPAITTPRP